MKILLIQTAYLGDAILSTALVENLGITFHEQHFIDVVVRKGAEEIFENNPYINKVFIFNKKEKKWRNLFSLIREIRNDHYQLVINLHRYFSSGLITACSRADEKRGFKQNPFSIFYHKKFKHKINTYAEIHEVERNYQLIRDLVKQPVLKPVIYMNEHEKEHIYQQYVKGKEYICIAPNSVWQTKRLPEDKWITLMDKTKPKFWIYLLGSSHDYDNNELLISSTGNERIINLAGKLNLRESAYLMSRARLNYVLDSAPLHLASAMNAPVVAIYCSTVPGFGFGPLSDESYIVENLSPLHCRPCGIHGKRSCPEKHFKCGKEIEISSLLKPLNL